MNKQAISKKIIGVVVAIVMLFSFVPTVAVNAASVPMMSSTVQTSIFTGNLSMGGSFSTYQVDARGVLYSTFKRRIMGLYCG